MADESEENVAEVEQKPALYAPGPDAIDITPDKDGGVLKAVLRAGEGEERPLAGDTVYVHYVGTLLSDGSKFDSSRDRNEQFVFSLGNGAVIKAWDLGVATMQRGELAVLQCKAEYAYGEKGSPPNIPGGATLIFEVELFDWKGEDVSEEKDDGILKSVLKEGEGYKRPHEMTTCHVRLVGRHGGRVFQDEELSFVVGEVFDGLVVPGVEQAVQQLKKAETAKFKVKAKNAYGETGNSKFNIPPNADVEYEIELKDFNDPAESWQLDNTGKLSEAELARAKGTDLFKAGRYAVALRYYKRVVELISTEDSLEGDEAEQRKRLLLASHLNTAMCHLKLNGNAEVIEACDEALKLDAKSEKGLFRRGVAHLNMANHDLAAADFRATLAVEPTNKAARVNLATAVSAIREVVEREKKTYKGMFSKFAEEDAKKAKASEPISVWKDGDKAEAGSKENGAEASGDGDVPCEGSEAPLNASTPETLVDA